MLQHGPGFRVLSRDLFRQCLHLGHKPVDERHHLVHGLLEGIFIFRVFIGTGNKRPQRLRRSDGVIQRVRRQFLQGFLPAQFLAFDLLVLLLFLRYPAVQVVSFRISQQLQYHILQVLGLLPHLLPDVVPPFVGRHPRQISFLRVQCHHHALGGRVYTVGAPVPNAVHHRVMHPVGLGVPVQQRQHHRLGLSGPGGFRRVHHPRVSFRVRPRQLSQLRLDFLPQALRYLQPRILRRCGLLPRLVGDAVHPVLQHGPKAHLAFIFRHGPAVLPRLVRALKGLPVYL